MENNQRAQWGSNFGFLMAAVGSAVGLGNIWGFPYKLGANGGFAFLLIYLILVVVVGLATMLGELAIGRITGKSAVFAYRDLAKKWTFLGYAGVAAGFFILAFYSVIGGIVIRYMVSFLLEMFKSGAGFLGMGSGEYFGYFISNAGGSIFFHALFMAITILIVMGGVSGGIEKFCKFAMPALVVILLIVIIRSITLPGAGAGLAYIFKPNLEPLSTLSGFFSVLRTAAGQMFFSLSLGMGCMITYGSYLSKKENLMTNSIFICIADSTVALLAAIAIMPAVFAFGLEPGGGPGLLFVTLHEVFTSGMGGFVGSLFGFLFYLLVFFAAVTSSISLLEVCASFFIDKQQLEGKKADRKVISGIIGAIIFVVGIPVAMDGLGGGSIIKETFWFNKWGFIDFYDLISEGILMPLGAALMSVLIGWKLKTKIISDEVAASGKGIKLKAYKFWDICFRFVVPIGMLLVLWGQFLDFGLI
ncbi:sodium-dependent transporter [Eubacteriales bacterium OttesenSCG-928-K08]|nr:sodium-dependent transporter [Eubacteriales bacterium OttesenSCG-928-K08]